MASVSTGNLFSAIASSVGQRRRGLLAGLVLVALAWGGSALWRLSRGPLRNDPRFQVTAQSVRITSQPPWVRGDIRGAALERARMQGPLSMIEPEQLSPRVAEAFRLQPWVKRVNRVELRAPNRVLVDLDWRRPVAVVQVSIEVGARLLPLDEEAIRLPEQDLADAELRYLPRITPVHSAPTVGEAWLDKQVTGALLLIGSLGADWGRLSLAEVTPSERPEIRGERQFYRFELLSEGGTRIVWVAAPNVAVPDEPSFDVKLRGSSSLSPPTRSNYTRTARRKPSTCVTASTPSDGLRRRRTRTAPRRNRPRGMKRRIW